MNEALLNEVVDTEEAWLAARLPLDDVARRISGIDTTLDAREVQAVGFPYLLFTFRWESRRWGRTCQELMSCMVDRCQGVSTTLERIEFGSSPASPVLLQPALDTPPLERKARQHVMQVRRHRLKRRAASGLELVASRRVRKPLWRVVARHQRHGDIELLLDGVTGGYYVM
ncbi:hypothetical protein FZZ93_12050 [Halomonas eurihalina]|uniref:Uncharacterized protein n=1 Tax=Halomonas eurihalina TaxID=42566 RepID=A0A5D9CZF4_HALER|nr:hypothetical protein [Halomonas eurihalina]MDR5860897.1 hypothetical protein [Halomonas eurihalina]TZG35881.1 hypothetical protein FZZ93_12050 [Halomonas eurihalina]